MQIRDLHNLFQKRIKICGVFVFIVILSSSLALSSQISQRIVSEPLAENGNQFSPSIGSTGDFSLVASSSILNGISGDDLRSVVAVTSLNGFSGTVQLSVLTVSPGLSAIPYLQPEYVTLVSGQSANSTLVLVGVSGQGSLIVIAHSGKLSHSLTITLNVSGPVICIASDTSTVCPASPEVISPAQAGDSQVRVAILIEGSEQFSGFDISLFTDSSVLKPAGIDLAGTILQGTTIIANCIGGVLKAGPRCATTDTPNTIHLAVVGSFLVFGPIKGRLFTAIYNITGQAPYSRIAFQKGCDNSFQHSVPGICVEIANGSPFSVRETVQEGAFSNMPSFSLELDKSGLYLPLGKDDASTLVVKALNGFAGNVSLTATVFPAGPRVVVTPSSVMSSPDSSSNVSFMTIEVPSYTSPGNYTVTLTGNSGLLSNVATLVIRVPVPDFAVVPIPKQFSVNVNSTGTSTIIVASLASFNGQLSFNVNATFGLTAKLSSTQASLAKEGVVTTNLTASASNFGYYNASITVIGGSISHNAVVNVNMRDFSLTFPQPAGQSLTLALVRNSPRLFEVQAQSVVLGFGTGRFLGNITLSWSSTPASGLFVSCSPSILNLTLYQPSSTSTCEIGSSVLGNYSLRFTGTSGSISHSIAITVSILSHPPPPPPDFSIQINPSSQTVTPGGTASYTITLSSLNGFNGNIGLTTFSSTTGLSESLNHSSLLVLRGGSATATLTISTIRATPIATSRIAIEATSGQLSHYSAVDLIVQPLSPVLVQLHWKHQVSLAKNNDTIVFVAGAFNPNNSTSLTIRFAIEIFRSSTNGTVAFAADSGTIKLPPLETVRDIRIPMHLPSSARGFTFRMLTRILWTPDSLGEITSTSTAHGIRNTAIIHIPQQRDFDFRAKTFCHMQKIGRSLELESSID